jgi:hypothetical protein
VFYHSTKLLKTNLPVKVRIRLDDRSVHELLELHVCQVVPNHHLQDLEQLPIGNEAVIVHVIDSENEPKLVLASSLLR